MIFVTVGTQLPFDRLIAAVDHWAGLSGRADVFAQTCGGTYRPAHMMNRARITPAECREYFARADIVVAHAGMGTIISAIEAGKPLVIVPRRMDFGEHRNDHQVATCERFCNLPNVFVANTEEEIPEKIDAALAASQFDATTLEASEELLGVIGAFLADTQSLKDVDGVICFGGVDYFPNIYTHAVINDFEFVYHGDIDGAKNVFGDLYGFSCFYVTDGDYPVDEQAVELLRNI